MKGVLPLFLGIFGTFAFSWLGLTVIPNLQIGHLNPQTDEEGGDVYPAPPSGMMLRGATCLCGERLRLLPQPAGATGLRSRRTSSGNGASVGARRAIIFFQPIAFLGQMRTGPDLANVGKRPALQNAGAAATKNSAPVGSPAPAVAGRSGADDSSRSARSAAAPAETKAVCFCSSGRVRFSLRERCCCHCLGIARASCAGDRPRPKSAAQLCGSGRIRFSSASVPVATASASPPAQSSPATTSTAATTPGEIVAPTTTPDGKPLPYTAAWHHQHLYARAVSRRIRTCRAFPLPLPEAPHQAARHLRDSLNFAGNDDDRPAEGWEIVPTYDAKCLVAYLMSLDQSHALKEAKSATAPASSPPRPGKEAKK